MKKKKEKTKSAKKLKYAAFSKAEATPKIKPSEASKEERKEAEKSYSVSMRVFRFLEDHKNRKTFKKSCDVCKKRTIFNRTKDNGLICSRCGAKVGGDSKVNWDEKLGKQKI